MYTLNIAIIINPVISKLANPFKRAYICNVRLAKFINNIFGMDIKDNKCINCNFLLGGEGLANKLNEIIELGLRECQILFDFIVTNSLFDEGRPPNLRSIEYTLARVVASPFSPRSFFIFIDTVFELKSDRLHHHFFNLIHPIFYIFLVRVDIINKINLLLFGWKHGDNMLFIIKLDWVNVFEDLLQVGLHCCWLFCLRQDLQQIVIR